jgi:hypothetical protein
MKKTILSIALLAFFAGAANAQNHLEVHDHGHDHGAVSDKATQTKAPTTLTPENVSFKADVYDFGTIPEGPSAEHVFTFTNTGKEPIVIERVQPSCGCTAPDWTKEPIAPGKTGMVKATYGTQGRPGHFEKNMTVFTNAGTKMVTFKGSVEKAPETSVPQNGSLMRTN